MVRPIAAIAHDEAIDRQDDNRADYRSDKPRALISLVPPNLTAEPGGHHRPPNTEQDRDDKAAWGPAWHDVFGDGAGNEADDDSPKESKQR